MSAGVNELPDHRVERPAFGDCGEINGNAVRIEIESIQLCRAFFQNVALCTGTSLRRRRGQPIARRGQIPAMEQPAACGAALQTIVAIEPEAGDGSSAQEYAICLLEGIPHPAQVPNDPIASLPWTRLRRVFGEKCP